MSGSEYDRGEGGTTGRFANFTEAEVAKSDEERAGVIIDYDAFGNIVEIEYLDTSSKMEIPEKIVFKKLSDRPY